ncbi:MAG: ParB N-terminal domain-containing protein [Solirubrobacterales bacterium]
MANCGSLLELDDLRGRLGLVEGGDVGSRVVEVERIVGTVDRCCDFDRCFHPLRPELRGAVAAVRDAFPKGEFPPISVVRVDEAYFVVDGHKRVAAARSLGVEMIDAQVTRLRSPYPVTHETGAGDLPLLEAEARFRRESGLLEARPKARVPCSAPAGYAELLDSVRAHGYELSNAQGRVVPAVEVADDSYGCAYASAQRAADAAGITRLLPGCQPGDLGLTLRRSGNATSASCEEHDRAAHDSAAAEKRRLATAGPRRLRWLPFRRRTTTG